MNTDPGEPNIEQIKDGVSLHGEVIPNLGNVVTINFVGDWKPEDFRKILADSNLRSQIKLLTQFS